MQLQAGTTTELNEPPKSKFFYASAESPTDGWPRVKCEFMNWIGGVRSKQVARIRLRIEGKTRKTVRCCTLQRTSRIVGDSDLSFAVFRLTPPLPPVWRSACLDIAHDVVTMQIAGEGKA